MASDEAETPISDLSNEVIWSVGDVCYAPWSGDDTLYKGLIKKLQRRESGRIFARVKFEGYDSDESEEFDVCQLQQIRKECGKLFCGSQEEQLEKSPARKGEGPGFLKPLSRSEELARIEDKYGHDSDSETECVRKLPTLKSSATRGRTSEWKIRSPGISQQSLQCRRKASVISGGSPRKIPRRTATNMATPAQRDEKQQSPQFHKDSKSSPETEAVVKRDVSITQDKRSLPMDGISGKESIRKNFKGFDDDDMQKPKFSFPPSSAKVAFAVTEDNSKIKVPASLNQYLRDYQREGIRFLYSHFANGHGAILGDDMGLGKTVQIIGFLSALCGKQGDQTDVAKQKPRFIQMMSGYSGVEEDFQRRPFLIIGPGSVLYNWLEEFDTWTYFIVRKYHGADKASCLADVHRGKVEVVITTFETFRDNLSALNAVDWEAVIVDEVHRIKGMKAQTTRALRSMQCMCRYGLTGTALQNNMSELWCILDWAQPGILGSAEQFEEEFVKPVERGQNHDATKRELAEARRMKEMFTGIRNQILLRRTKRIIADQLPTKIDRVVFCRLTSLQVNVYQTLLSQPDMVSVMSMDDQCACGSGRAKAKCCYQKTRDGRKLKSVLFTFMHLLLKTANHAALLIPHARSSPEQQKRAKELCQIAFKNHPEFINQTREAAFRTLSDPMYCGKMKVLGGILKVFAKTHSKVLLFSYSTRILDILEQYIMSEGHEYRRIDGSITGRRRQEIVREFNADASIFICLISTKAGGLGLNLTGANKVVIFDPNWNPSHDLQAQDRAYRIGQRRDVEVYRLISVGTIEENVYLRQIYKQQLDHVAVGSENARRYFRGIQGDQINKGELFGVKNMFQLRTGDTCLTMDILNRNAKVEAGISGYDVTDYIPSSQEQPNSGDDDGEEEMMETVGSDEESDNVFKDLFSSASDSENDLSVIPPTKNQDVTIKDPVVPIHRCSGKVRDLHAKGGNGNGENSHISLDSMDTPSFTSVASVFKKCGVVHVHDNPEVVGASRVEDHMSRCAMKHVYELHNNSQELALQCDPMSQSMQEIATKSKKSQSRNKGTKKGAREKTCSKDHNSAQVVNHGKWHILVGQTPIGIQRQHWIALKEQLNCQDEETLAVQVALASPEERLSMLRNLYRHQHGEPLKEVVDSLLTVMDGKSKNPKLSVSGSGKVSKEASNLRRKGQRAKSGKNSRNGEELLTGNRKSAKKRPAARGLIYSSLEESKPIQHASEQSKSDDDMKQSPSQELYSKITPKKRPQTTLCHSLKKTHQHAHRLLKAETESKKQHNIVKSGSKRDLNVAEVQQLDLDNDSDNEDVNKCHQDVDRLLNELGKHTNVDFTKQQDVSFHKLSELEPESGNLKPVRSIVSRKDSPKTNILDIFSESPDNKVRKRKPPPARTSQKSKQLSTKNQAAYTSILKKDNCEETSRHIAREETSRRIACKSSDHNAELSSELFNTSTLCDDEVDCFGESGLWKKCRKSKPVPPKDIHRLFPKNKDDYQALFDSGLLVRKRSHNKLAVNRVTSEGDDIGPQIDASESLFS